MQLFLASTMISVAMAASAPMVVSNPNSRFIADFPYAGNASTTGFVVFAVGDLGQVNVHVDLTKLPKDGGDFSYKIHENGVGWGSANCEAAGAVFDPFGAGNVNCEAVADDSQCAVGDLSGKHGRFTATCFEHTYVDPYLSLDPALDAFIGGRSVVVYHNDKVLACASIHEFGGDDPQWQPEPPTEAETSEFVESEVTKPTEAQPSVPLVSIATESNEMMSTITNEVESQLETSDASADVIITSMEESDVSDEASTMVESTVGSRVPSASPSNPPVTQESNVGVKMASLVAAMVAMVAMML